MSRIKIELEKVLKERKISKNVGCSIADILVLEKDEEPEQEIAEK